MSFKFAGVKFFPLRILVVGFLIFFLSPTVFAESNVQLHKSQISPISPKKFEKKGSQPKLDVTTPPRDKIKWTEPKDSSLWGRIRQNGREWMERILGGAIFQVCGNGEREGREQCDDGNTVNEDGCSCSCYQEPGGVCGDGDCNMGEADYVLVRGERVMRCHEDCYHRPLHERPLYRRICGNCLIDGSGEECDDGNRIDWDDCSNACRISEEERERRLCAPLPVGTELPPGYIVREYEDARQISRCLDETTERIIVCGAEEEVTRNTIPCEIGRERCISGACTWSPSATCTETDDGDNPNSGGHTSGTHSNGETYSHRDQCDVDGHDIYEHFCDGVEMRSAWRECETGLVCRSQNPAVPPLVDGAACMPGSLVECDETDDGDNPNVAGDFSVTLSTGEIYTHWDWCPSSREVHEYFCEGVEIQSGRRECETGLVCRGGACVSGSPDEPTCTETDDGDDRNTGGYLHEVSSTGASSLHWDSCEADGREVLEYYCEGGEVRRERRECGAGLICLPIDPSVPALVYGAACVTPCPICQPTPWTTTTRGSVTGVDCVIQQDICRDRQIIRFQCSDEGMPVEDPLNFEDCDEFGCRDGLCCTREAPCLEDLSL